MNIIIKNMTEKFAIEILTWKYERPYDMYNNVLSGDAIIELLDRSYKAITDENHNLIGFYCVGKSAQVPAGRKYQAYVDDCIDLGIGMKPELTGQGYGTHFLAQILEYITKHDEKRDIRLTVATFNKRAIHLYEKFNFIKKMTFHRDDTEFITMIKENTNEVSR
ncbi:GNAT family N-acetyltransferase [Ornithinibacillus sp. L9]|uniref:GNAT family N-acetyltransferase n=1 Tax=Ornithinibacillus caprae TaxID=2678566 RepID=A0A6N8FI27_9BACI|nr:GNAT family N-acetyltransferase [Ornithinibacillus caprae]MUK88881.1 GNAT family N-acetyltransferase [Ornithinibacillus caprae]